MKNHERIFGNIIIGVILGMILASLIYGVFNLLLRGDYSILGGGGRQKVYSETSDF